MMVFVVFLPFVYSQHLQVIMTSYWGEVCVRGEEVAPVFQMLDFALILGFPHLSVLCL